MFFNTKRSKKNHIINIVFNVYLLQILSTICVIDILINVY